MGMVIARIHRFDTEKIIQTFGSSLKSRSAFCENRQRSDHHNQATIDATTKPTVAPIPSRNLML
jgi:hypothetical protein